MINKAKKTQWVFGLLALLLAGQIQAAVIMTGTTDFFELTGLWSGTLSAEISGTAGNYTSTFTIVMDADSDASATLIRDINISSWMLGAAGFNEGATSGGSIGGDPSLVINPLPIFISPIGNEARFDFTGLAEGSTSAQFWFNHADLVLTGDSVVFGVSDFGNFSASGFTLDLIAVPLPATIVLFSSGLFGLASFVRRKKR